MSKVTRNTLALDIPNVGDTLTFEQYVPCASVVMIQGETGTAYQRFFSDGYYHGTNRTVVDRQYLVRQGATVIYVAPYLAEEN